MPKGKKERETQLHFDAAKLSSLSFESEVVGKVQKESEIAVARLRGLETTRK